jgi:hypothetical protein
LPERTATNRTPRNTEDSPQEQAWNIPAPVRSFLGRRGEIEHLHRLLNDGRQSTLSWQGNLAALSGMGGVGKTQLARAYAFENRTAYTTGWWISSENPKMLVESIMALATAEGVPEVEETVEHGKSGPTRVKTAIRVEERLSRLWRILGNRDDWLLVFDNAVDLPSLEPYFPPRGGGHVIITSRNPAWHGVAESVQVDIFPEDVAIELLLSRTNTSDEVIAAKLAEELGRLPLALEQAAAYASTQGISLAQYHDLFQARRADLLKRGSPLAYQGTVDTVVSLTLDALRRGTPLAVVLVEMCAFFAPDEIPTAAIIASDFPLAPDERVPDRLARTEALGALHRTGLLIADVDDTDRLHRLFQAVILRQLSPADYKLRIEFIADIIDELVHPRMQGIVTSGFSLTGMPPEYHEFRLHVESVVGHGRGVVVSTAFANLLEIFATSVMLEGGGYPAAERIYLEATEIRRAAEAGQ